MLDKIKSYESNIMELKKYGAILSKNEIKELTLSQKDRGPLIEEMIDQKIQIQPNGVDLSVKKIERFIGPGKTDFDNKKREISNTKEIEFDGDEFLFLESGAYKITFNEVVNLPLDLIAIAAPRSTLLRCGVTVETAIWDAGYSGRGQSLLIVMNKTGYFIKKNARVIQLMFIRLSGENTISEGYNGKYQMENI